MVWKVKENNIEFITPHKSLLETAPPVPGARMIPDWFTKMSNDIPNFDGPFPKIGNWIKEFSSHTIKKCPAVVDYFAEGYVIPLWSDILIQKNGDNLHWENNNVDIGIIEFHNFEQAPTYYFKEKDYRQPLKFISPWWFRTPPGWSTLFLQPQLHPQDNYTLFPGVVETDSFQQINFPAVWHTEGDTILKRGTPFLHVIPFKREKTKLVNRFADAEDHDMIAYQQTALRSKFTGGYRDITRRFRKKLK